MKIKNILLVLIIGFPIMSFAQFSVITTYNRADTAVQVKFINSFSNKQVVVMNETHMYDGGSFCDVHFIGAKGDTLSWFRCHYVNKIKPSMLVVLIQPKQQENFIFELKRIKYETDLKYVKKIKVHVMIKRVIEGTNYLKDIDYHKEFLLQ